MINLTEAHIEEAIEKTLLYYKLFNSGVSLYALHSFLLDQQVTAQQLDSAIQSLLQKKKVLISNDTIFLDKEINSIYNRKNQRLNNRLTKKLLKLLKNIPFISAIAFSGGTANYGIENHEDIDLFIITKPYSVYIVYFMIHIASLLFRSRKILCINYLIDETALEIRIQRDLFTAHQIIALKPFKNETFLHHFLSNNDWVNNHYPNFVIPQSKDHKSSSLYLFFRPFNSILNRFYRLRYKKYFDNSNPASVVLSEHIIKLHTNDYRLKVINEFHHQWNKYIVEKNKVSFS